MDWGTRSACGRTISWVVGCMTCFMFARVILDSLYGSDRRKVHPVGCEGGKITNQRVSHPGCHRLRPRGGRVRVRYRTVLSQGTGWRGGENHEATHFQLHACFIYSRLRHEADILPSRAVIACNRDVQQLMDPGGCTHQLPATGPTSKYFGSNW